MPVDGPREYETALRWALCRAGGCGGRARQELLGEEASVLLPPAAGLLLVGGGEQNVLSGSIAGRRLSPVPI